MLALIVGSACGIRMSSPFNPKSVICCSCGSADSALVASHENLQAAGIDGPLIGHLTHLFSGVSGAISSAT